MKTWKDMVLPSRKGMEVRNQIELSVMCRGNCSVLKLMCSNFLMELLVFSICFENTVRWCHLPLIEAKQ